MEEDKQSLMQVSQGKSDAISLMQIENKKQITAIEEHCRLKLETQAIEQKAVIDEKVKHEEMLLQELEFIKCECSTLHGEIEEKVAMINALDHEKNGLVEGLVQMIGEEEKEKFLEEIKCKNGGDLLFQQQEFGDFLMDDMDPKQGHFVQMIVREEALMSERPSNEQVDIINQTDVYQQADNMANRLRELEDQLLTQKKERLKLAKYLDCKLSEILHLKLETKKLMEIIGNLKKKCNELEELQTSLITANVQLWAGVPPVAAFRKQGKDKKKKTPLTKTDEDGIDVKAYDDSTNMLIQENKSLTEQIRNIECEIKNCTTQLGQKEQMIEDHEKQSAFEIIELQNRLEDVEQKLASKINESTDYYVQAEAFKNHADNVNSDMRVEIAKLTAAVFENESAMNEVREHYEMLLQEKNLKIKEFEGHATTAGPVTQENAEVLCPEPSGWDDTWALPDEICEHSSPVSNVCLPCDQHVKQIEALKEMLEEKNSKLEEYKILLRLSAPDTPNSTCSISNNLQSPERTETEYLKNILYQYMMGKEPETLVKVIAAVVKFDEEQTKKVVDKVKEKAKQSLK